MELLIAREAEIGDSIYFNRKSFPNITPGKGYPIEGIYYPQKDSLDPDLRDSPGFVISDDEGKKIGIYCFWVERLEHI